MSETNLSGIDWKNDKSVVSEVFPNLSTRYNNCGMHNSYWQLLSGPIEIKRVYCGAMTDSQLWRETRQHPTVQAFEAKYNPAFQQSGMTSEERVKADYPDCSIVEEDGNGNGYLCAVATLHGAWKNSEKEAYDDAASKLPPVPASPDKGEEVALPPLGDGYHADLITCITEQQRAKWRKQWAKMDDDDCKRHHYKHYEWECRKTFEELERREVQLLTALQRVRELEGERDQPETEDFFKGVPLEAAHQRHRWGVEHDGGKAPMDWFWLVGYLAGKCLAAHIAGNQEKALHHAISTAAACANWHLAIKGKTNMRPGIEAPETESELAAFKGEK